MATPFSKSFLIFTGSSEAISLSGSDGVSTLRIPL
jgi:hypothetical protein